MFPQTQYQLFVWENNRKYKWTVRKDIDKHEDQLSPDVENYMSKGMSEKKSLRHLYIKNVFEIGQQRQDPLFKGIMEKAKEFMGDGLDRCEAITSAVAYQKYARLLNLPRSLSEASSTV